MLGIAPVKLDTQNRGQGAAEERRPADNVRDGGLGPASYAEGGNAIESKRATSSVKVTTPRCTNKYLFQRSWRELEVHACPAICASG